MKAGEWGRKRGEGLIVSLSLSRKNGEGLIVPLSPFFQRERD
jgi:hypothetical protein